MHDTLRYRISFADPRWAIAAVCLVFALACPADAAEPVDEARSSAGVRLEEKEAWSPESVWSQFVEHMEAQGKVDLFPVGLLPEDHVAPEDEDHEGHDHAEGEAPHHHEHPLPDLSKGDPILGVLFRTSKDLVRLHAQFEDPELAARKGEKRDAKIAKLVEAIRESEDPFLREYGEHFAARHALEKGDLAAARKSLERLVESDRFLLRAPLRRDLAKVYREQGEKTLAILELQFYMADLSADQDADRLWANEELTKIREGHDGPLKECADRARSISELIAVKKVGARTQGEQEDVEKVLEKIAKLLEDQANRCPSCQERVSKKTGRCKESCSSCGQCKSNPQAHTSEGECIIEVAMKGKKPGGKPGQQPGQEKKPGQGDPRGNKPGEQAAKDTKLRQGDPGDPRLKDLPASIRDQWGKINDREVQRSLREVWARMPVRYRQLVKGYYDDINEVDVPRKKASKK